MKFRSINSKTKKSFEICFENELENYKKNFDSNEVIVYPEIKISYLWSLVNEIESINERKFVLFTKISSDIFENKFDISCSNPALIQFYNRMYIIYKYLIESNLNLEMNRLHENFKKIGDKPLGRGTFGRVYKCSLIQGKENYAVKIIKLRELNSTSFGSLSQVKLNKTLREVNIWSKLNHANIVQFNSAWLEYNNQFILSLHIQMELCDFTLKNGLSLMDKEMGSTGSLISIASIFIRSQLLLEIVEALNYLHTQKVPIIHRDIKMSNILIKIDKGGKFIKLCDFGLSTCHQREFNDGALKSQSHTNAVGTVGYMAPEVRDGKIYNERSDIHCLGRLILKMFKIEDSYCLEEILRDTKFNLLSEANTEIVDSIMIKFKSILNITSNLLEKHPSNRLSASELLEQSDEWCINCLDVEEVSYIQEILKKNTSTHSNRQLSLHKAVILKKFESFIEKDISLKSKSFRKLHNIYPALQKISRRIIAHLESFYIFGEIEDKLFYVTINDQVYESTISKHNDSVQCAEKKMTELCNQGVRTISCGERHVIALTRDGLLYAWGDNSCGQLGDGSNRSRDRPKRISFFKNFKIIDVCCGAYHSLALTDDGQVYSWGHNRMGQIGNNKYKHNEWTPCKVIFPYSDRCKAISCGYHHSMALTFNGSVYSWGHNEYGQLGLGCLKLQIYPQQVDFTERIEKIACGKYHSLFLTNEGKIFGCGCNCSGEIGCRTKKNQNIPIIMKDSIRFTEISASIFDSMSIAQSELNSFYMCGKCGNDEILTLKKTNHRSFHEVRMIHSISRKISQPIYNHKSWIDFLLIRKNGLNLSRIRTKISPDVNFFCIHNYMETKVLLMTDKNDVYITKLRTDGSKSNSITHKITEFGGETIMSLVSGKLHTLALTKSGKIYSWGNNNNGQLGYKYEPFYYKPKRVLINSSKMIACGAYHSLALADSGEVYAWGQNYRGECGNGFKKDQFVPTRILLPTDEIFTGIASGHNYSLAVTESGKVFSWGNNEFGQLGLGNKLNPLKPSLVRLAISTKVIKAVCGMSHSLFLTNDGNIFACGLNHLGQLGNGTDIDQTTPNQISCHVQFVDIFASIFDHISVALSADGKCYIWGQCSGKMFKLPKRTEFDSIHEAFVFYSESKFLNQKITLKS